MELSNTDDSHHRIMTHNTDVDLLQPFVYLHEQAGKEMRGQMIESFQHWLKIPEDKIATIKGI